MSAQQQTAKLQVCTLFLRCCTWSSAVCTTVFQVSADSFAANHVALVCSSHAAPSTVNACAHRMYNTQVMTYKLLLEQLPRTCSLALLTKFFHLLQLDLMQPLSDTVQQHVQSTGLMPADITSFQPATLTSIAEQLQQQVSSMPTCSTHVKVRYIWQADSEVLGETSYEYDHAWLESKLQQHLDFWEGVWTPQVVPAQDNWKCRHCLFCEACPVGRDTVKHHC